MSEQKNSEKSPLKKHLDEQTRNEAEPSKEVDDDTDQEINPRYWKSQLYVSLWAVGYIGVAIISAGLIQVGLAPQLLILPFLAVTFIPLVVGILLAHFGFILDGRAVKKDNRYTWKPWWWAYFIGSWLTISILVSPIYLFRRHQATGRPNKDDIRRKLSIRGLLIPWH